MRSNYFEKYLESEKEMMEQFLKAQIKSSNTTARAIVAMARKMSSVDKRLQSIEKEMSVDRNKERAVFKWIIGILIGAFGTLITAIIALAGVKVGI